MKERTLLTGGGALLLLSTGEIALAAERAYAIYEFDATQMQRRRKLDVKSASANLLRFSRLALNDHNTIGLAHALINQPVKMAALCADLASLAKLQHRRPDLICNVTMDRRCHIHPGV